MRHDDLHVVEDGVLRCSAASREPSPVPGLSWAEYLEYVAQIERNSALGVEAILRFADAQIAEAQRLPRAEPERP